MSNPVSNFQMSAMAALAQGFPMDRVMAGRIPSCDDGKVRRCFSKLAYCCTVCPDSTSAQL